MLDEIIREYNEAVFDTDRERALEVIHSAVAAGVTPDDVIFRVVVPAIQQMVKGISEHFDANLAQHFMASQIASEVTDAMLELIGTAPTSVGKVVIGAADGDLHSLGKRIVIGCLKPQMIDVVDLGVNVPCERFVDEALASDAQVIGISAMMLHTARGENGCLGVRRLLKERGLERKIKVIVGGAPYRFDPGLYKAVGADAWADDGIAAGQIIKDLIREVSR